jgi:hypothetical protein
MSIIDWVGIAFLSLFGVLVICLIIYFILGCIGSSKRRQQVLLDRRAAREATQARRPADDASAGAASNAIADAADGL